MKTFWDTKKDGKAKVKKNLILSFLEERGYRNLKVNGKWQVIKVKDNIVQIIEDSIEARRELISCIIESEEVDNRGSILDQTLSSFKDIKRSGILDALEEISLNLLKGDEKTSYKFFLNGAVKVTASTIEVLPYSVLSGHVLKSEIIDFNIRIVPFVETKSSSFAQFLLRCMNKNTHNYDSLLSALGFLSSSFKSSKVERAIVFCDENQNDAAEGGTGKSLTAKALVHFNKAVIEDGKNFKQGQFVFQQIEFGTRLLVIDDTSKQFNFESLFSAVTGGFQIEKKYQDRFTIPFEESPRILITTNYTIFGRGFSFDRRILEIEFSNYYGRNIKPSDEFGSEFFSDWTNVEWNLFYNFMISCVSHFLDQGISEPIVRDRNAKRLRKETSRDFAEFVEEYDWPHEISKGELFRLYKEHYGNHTWLSIRTFNSWVKIYLESKCIPYSEPKKYGGTRFWQIGPKGGSSDKSSPGIVPLRPPVAPIQSGLEVQSQLPPKLLLNNT